MNTIKRSTRKACQILTLMWVMFPVLSWATILPASVEKVETYRINHFLARVIKHNMDVNPAFDIDMISLPDYRIIDSITIDSLYIGTDLLLFKNAEKVSIASFSPAGERVIFALDYAYPTGSSDRIDCVIAFDRGQVNQPICHLQSQPQACLNTTDNADDEGRDTSTHCHDAVDEETEYKETGYKETGNKEKGKSSDKG